MIETALFEKLEQMAERRAQLEKLLADPNVIANQGQFRAYLREHGSLGKVVPDFQRLKQLETHRAEAEAILAGEHDADMRQLAQEELASVSASISTLSAGIQQKLVEDDPDTGRNVIMEIRAGTGGEEACLFAADLFRMYSRYAEKRGWKAEVISSSASELDGFKEIIFSLSGTDVHKRMRYESGGHRVQRVPVTEAAGRIHTSAVTVAVLPEVEDIEVEIKDGDIRVDRVRASGPGGQNVNKLSSAIRITHFPTGIVVSIQDERSQHNNLVKAMAVLRSRIYDKVRAERDREMSQMRRELIGSGDRNDRIRTYNFPQNRLTDHRVNLSLYSLETILMGELDPVIDKLIEYDREQKLKEL